MLSHCNILSDAEAVLKLVLGYREDLYLSCLPLSHCFERTVGYCLPIMTGSTVAFARSVHELPQDLLAIRPTMLPESLAAPAVAQFLLARLAKLLRGFPAYARMRGAWLTLEPWTIENGLVTPTMKLKRPELERRFAAEIARLYAGHDAPA